MGKIRLKDRRYAIAFIAALCVLSLVLAMPMAVSAQEPSQESPSATDRLLIVKARGVAIQRVENDTVRMPARFELNLTLGPTRRRLGVTPVKDGEGTIEVNETVYTVENARGIILSDGHVAFIKLTGVDDTGESITLFIKARYFWMGRRLYVARAIGVLKTGETNTLLLLRVKALLI